jgi:hypothetical protein
LVAVERSAASDCEALVVEEVAVADEEADEEVGVIALVLK